MGSNFLTPPPPKKWSEEAEGERIPEGAAGVGKRPWSKPTIWIGRFGRLTESGTFSPKPTETTFYYISM